MIPALSTFANHSQGWWLPRGSQSLWLLYPRSVSWTYRFAQMQVGGPLHRVKMSPVGRVFGRRAYFFAMFPAQISLNIFLQVPGTASLGARTR